jgi:hypothetical protein
MKTKAETNFEMKGSSFERYKLEKRYRFYVGVYLSILSLVILFFLVSVSMSVTVQQALAVIVGLVILSALDAFRRSSEEAISTSSSAVVGNTYHVYNHYTNYADTYNTYKESQDLAKAAAEIQQLLNHLSQTYPTTTESEKMVLVEEVVEEIENNPSLRARVVSALRASGAAALEELINHPVNKMVIAVLEGWLAEEETKPSSKL